MELNYKKSEEFSNVKVPEGVYEAVLQAITEAPPGQYGQRIAMQFGVDANGSPHELSFLAYVQDDMTVTSNSKAGKALEALGADLGKLDTEKLVGNRCKVMVEDYTYKDKEGNEKVKSIVTKVKPLVEQESVGQ